jgi:hypothetical protein
MDKREDHLWVFMDQNAGIMTLTGKSPRQCLMDYYGTKIIGLMFEDDVDGKSHHCGYIVRGLWYRVYDTAQWEGTTTKPRRESRHGVQVKSA